MLTYFQQFFCNNLEENIALEMLQDKFVNTFKQQDDKQIARNILAYFRKNPDNTQPSLAKSILGWGASIMLFKVWENYWQQLQNNAYKNSTTSKEKANTTKSIDQANLSLQQAKSLIHNKMQEKLGIFVDNFYPRFMQRFEVNANTLINKLHTRFPSLFKSSQDKENFKVTLLKELIKTLPNTIENNKAQLNSLLMLNIAIPRNRQNNFRLISKSHYGFIDSLLKPVISKYQPQSTAKATTRPKVR